MAESDVPRIIFDYGFLKENVTLDAEGGTVAARASMTLLVMTETQCDSVWIYAVEGKGTLTEAWLAPKICEDLATVA